MKSAMAGLVLTLLAQAAFSRTPPQMRKQTKKPAVVESDPVFQFTGKIVFEGKVVRGSIRKSEIDSLLAHRVALGNPEYWLDFSFEEGHFPALSCQDWVQARAQELSAELNTRDRDIESPFVGTCGFLFALRGAKPARRSFIANPRLGLSNLNLLPAKRLGGSLWRREAETDKLTARGVRISDLVAKRKVKVLKRTKDSVVLDNYLEVHLTEMGRADFNGDGIEDIFVGTAKYATPGTFRYYDYLILTRRSPSAGFTVIKPDWQALGKDSASMSAGIELKSSQLNRVKITKQSYGNEWPFEADEGELACVNAGAVAVFFIVNGKTYALNAWARQSKIGGQPVSTNA
jgi:hypothetical protein